MPPLLIAAFGGIFLRRLRRADFPWHWKGDGAVEAEEEHGDVDDELIEDRHKQRTFFPFSQ